MSDTNPFGHMPTHEAYFRQHGKCLKYDKGERFIRSDDPTGYLYFIEQGHVKISWTLDSGDERIIAILPAGLSLRQQHSIYDAGAGTFDTTTFTPSTIWRVEEKLFYQQMQTDPAFTSELALQGFRTKDYLIDQLVYLGEPTIQRRFLRWLLLMAHWYGKLTQDGTLIDLPLTQETIGGFLYASRASVSPVIGALTRQRLIYTKKKYIVIPSIDDIKTALET